MPTWLLKGTRNVLKANQWARDAADRLAFAEVLANNETWTADMEQTYELLGIEAGSVNTLDAYLQVRAAAAASCGAPRGCPRRRLGWLRQGVVSVPAAPALPQRGSSSRSSLPPPCPPPTPPPPGVLQQDHEAPEGGGRDLGPHELLRVRREHVQYV